jgi:hypothetical protein
MFDDIDRMRNALYADAFEGGTFITEPLTYPTYGNAPRNAVT